MIYFKRLCSKAARLGPDVALHQISIYLTDKQVWRKNINISKATWSRGVISTKWAITFHLLGLWHAYERQRAQQTNPTPPHPSTPLPKPIPPQPPSSFRSWKFQIHPHYIKSSFRCAIILFITGNHFSLWHNSLTGKYWNTLCVLTAVNGIKWPWEWLAMYMQIQVLFFRPHNRLLTLLGLDLKMEILFEQNLKKESDWACV